ncbi:hypothetical protein DPEC_G00023260 [Dallia pectoralis]|uniref:Uncharacterized protein n=1 Tax=Dallia pectoralis TaxID=75939 RepID=A0ACC2HHQ1_DALPE|nr:hypothetical protein DPEC_G00023260 [Dallia pectoralis]
MPTDIQACGRPAESVVMATHPRLRPALALQAFPPPPSSSPSPPLLQWKLKRRSPQVGLRSTSSHVSDKMADRLLFLLFDAALPLRRVTQLEKDSQENYI